MCKSHEIFKLLGVKTRVKILNLLKSNGSMSVNKLSEKLGITPSAVSQHLKAMKELNFVKSHRDGYKIPYSVNEKMLKNCKNMLDEVCECGCHKNHRNHHKIYIKNINDIEKLNKQRDRLNNKLNKIEERIKILKNKNK